MRRTVAGGSGVTKDEDEHSFESIKLRITEEGRVERGKEGGKEREKAHHRLLLIRDPL